MATQTDPNDNPDNSTPPTNPPPTNPPPENPPKNPPPKGNPWDVKGAWTPTSPAELKAFAAAMGWSEDFARFGDNIVKDWIARYWDPNARKFRTQKTDMNGNKIEGFVEKPPDLPEGWTAWGARDQAIRNSDLANRGGGNGGNGGAPAGWGEGSPYGGSWTMVNGVPVFRPPTYEEALKDPGFQFSLQQGVKALEGSAAAAGTLRTGGTLQGILGLGQQLAAQRYGDVFNRNLSAFGANSGNWATKGGWDLSKWTTTENNIANALNTPPPTPPAK